MATWHRETLVCLGVGVPALVYVFATNRTASAPLIALHAALLGVLTPMAVSLFDLVAPRPSNPGWPSFLRDLAVRIAGLAVALAGMLAVIAFATPFPLSVLVGSPLAAAMVPVFLAYGLIAVLLQWTRQREVLLRAQLGEARSRQAALAARIRPHFFFNALNCIEALTEADPAIARVAVGRLARLMRSVLAASSSPFRPMGLEAQLVEDYLGIERLRFGARFTFELHVAPDVAQLEIPATILLTLAENAVKHGVEAVAGPAHLRLDASSVDPGALVITMTGTSPGTFSETGDAGRGGYGLVDVRERLDLAYSKRAILTIQAEGGCSRVQLTLPC